MAERVGEAPLTKRCLVGRQIPRINIVSDTPEDYWRRVDFSPFIDCLKKKQLIDRFQGKVASAIKAAKVISNNLEQCKAEDEALLLEYYNKDLPSSSTFNRN